MREKVLFGPGDWLAGRFTARERRALAAWLMILFVISIPATWPWKDKVWLVWLVSMIALVLAMAGVVSAETPVEAEEVNVEADRVEVDGPE